jgi:excisionase family DNA binding protein
MAPELVATVDQTTQDADAADLPPFLTPKEAAARLRVSRWAIYDAVNAGTLPAVRVGRCIRIPKHAVVAESGGVSPNGD